jgi:hypothetical protein
MLDPKWSEILSKISSAAGVLITQADEATEFARHHPGGGFFEPATFDEVAERVNKAYDSFQVLGKVVRA